MQRQQTRFPQRLALELLHRAGSDLAVPDDRQAEGILRFVAGQTTGRIQNGAELVIWRHFVFFGGDATGDRFQLGFVRQSVRQDNEQFFQFQRDVRRRGEYQKVVPLLLAGLNLLRQRLHNLRVPEEPVKIFQDQQGRLMGAGSDAEVFQHRQRIGCFVRFIWFRIPG